MTEDPELLRRYAEKHSEDAFAELVRRHVNLVYHAALRQTGSDTTLAEDATQAVFTDLARKARSLLQRPVITGWLYTSTRFAATKAKRTERRRQAREQEAHLMHELTHDSAAAADWERLRPVIDDALHALDERDREAVLLRFFEGRPFADVGAKLSLSEDTARVRVGRALDKMHALLAKRGLTSTSAALAVALANQAGVAAPAGLAASVTGAAMATSGAAVGAAASGGLIATFMSMTKLQVGITTALAVASVTGFTLQAQSNARLRDETVALGRQTTALTQARTENDRLKLAATEVAGFRSDDVELARLTEESAALSVRLGKVASAERVQAAAKERSQALEAAQLDRQPQPTFTVRPEYPADARRLGVGGEALMDIIIGAKGDILRLANVKCSLTGTRAKLGADGAVRYGDMTAQEMAGLLNRSAMQAVMQWKFTPGEKDGRAVGAHIQLPIVFAPDETEP